MRIRLTVESVPGGWKVTTTSPDDKDWKAPQPRTLVVNAQGGYPRAAAEEPVDSTKPWGLLMAGPDADLRTRQQNILFGDVARTEVAAFGEYLFRTLLGPTWNAVVTAFPNAPLDIE